jgi:hypothetical protein
MPIAPPQLKAFAGDNFGSIMSLLVILILKPKTDCRFKHISVYIF